MFRPTYNFSEKNIRHFAVPCTYREWNCSRRHVPGYTYKERMNRYQYPYLLAFDMGECVTYGYLYDDKAHPENSRIEMFHSMSQHYHARERNLHHPYCGEPFIDALHQFLEAIPDTSKESFTIVVATRGDVLAEIRVGLLDIFIENANECIKIINESREPGVAALSPIGMEHFSLITKEISSFYLTLDGEYGTIESAIYTALPAMRDVLKETFIGSQLNSLDKIIEEDNEDEIMNLFVTIKQAAESSFMSDYEWLSDNEKIAYLQVISWDPYINAPGDWILVDWRQANSGRLNESQFRLIDEFSQAIKPVKEIAEQIIAPPPR